MPTTLPTQRERDPAGTTQLPRVDATLGLSARTLGLLASRPLALAVVESVWVRLAELEAAGHPAGLLAAVRFALIHHEPTRAGRCRTCQRVSWRGVWRPLVSLRGVAPDPGGTAGTPRPRRGPPPGTCRRQERPVMSLTGLERLDGPFLERLAATVAAQSVLREVVALAEEAPQISDEALRARLTRLITMLPRSGVAPRTPALPGDPGPGPGGFWRGDGHTEEWYMRSVGHADAHRGKLDSRHGHGHRPVRSGVYA